MIRHLLAPVLLAAGSVFVQGCGTSDRPCGTGLENRVPMGEHAAPDAAYPPATTGLTRVTPPVIPRPEYLVPVTDPVFKTLVTRITDARMDILGLQTNRQQKVLRHHYSKDQPWNCDGSLIKIAKCYLLDGRTYQVAGTYTRPSAETFWSYRHPRKMWTFDYRKMRLETIHVLPDPQTGMLTSTSRVVRAFPGFDQMFMGRYEGNLSWDDRFVALMGQKGDDLHVVVYDIANDRIVSEKVFAGKWPAGKDPRADWCSMSPSGEHVVVLWVDAGPGRYCGVEVFDRRMNFQRQLTVIGQHGDLGYAADGREAWVQVCCGHTDPKLNAKLLYDAAVVAFRLDDGSMIRVLDRRVTFGGHVSCRNFRRPGWAYITAADGMHEAFAVKLDGSQTVERFAHTHAIRTVYSAEAQGVASPDGARVMFASNWEVGTNASIYSYVAEFPGTGAATDKQ